MKTTGPIFGAFNQGGIPTIACFNKAKTPRYVDFGALIAAMQIFVDPAVNLIPTGPKPKLVYAYESADPVEELSFKINGIPIKALKRRRSSVR